MPIDEDPETRQVIDRWRREARGVLPSDDPDFIEEIAQFVAERWMASVAAGLPPSKADEAAAADLELWRSRPAPTRRSRPVGGAAWLGFTADVRCAARAARLRPTFAAAVVLLSTIAVAAVAGVFALAYGILWRPLPYPAADRLAVIWQIQRGEETQISFPDFEALAAASVFDGASGITGGRGSLRVGDRIERVNVLELDATGYSLLGAAPVLGRLLTPGDAGQPTAMVSHRLWSTHLNAEPSIVGRQLWLSGRTLTIVGVLPRGFDFELTVQPGTFRRTSIDVWTMLDRSVPFITRRDVSAYEGLVRVGPGRSWQEAQAAVDAIGRRLEQMYPATNSGRSFRLAPWQDELAAPVRRPMLLMAVAAGVTLLVALANLIVLSLVRGSQRQRELAVRHALGAGEFRLRRQLFVEHGVLAACGAIGGIVVARWLTHALVNSESAPLPRADAVQFDPPVIGVAMLVAVLIAGVLAIQPLQTTRSLLRSSGRSVTAGVRRSRRTMVSAEIALALTLATGGALFGLSLARLLAVDPGFTAEASSAARVSAYEARYPARDDVVRFFDDMLQRLRGRADVAAAGAGSSLPLSGQATGTSVAAQGRTAVAAERLAAGWEFITPGYLEAAGLRLTSGRGFTADDRLRDRHVTIVNTALARALFPGEDPLGRQIAVGGGDTRGDWHEIVGVVADVRHTALDRAPAPRVYDLFGQHWGRTLYVVVRSRTSDTAGHVSAIRSAVGALDAEAPVFEATTLRALMDRSTAARRLASTVGLSLAGAALLLALIGVYSVAAASAAERLPELGIRAALGASPRDLFAVITGEGGRTVAAGVIIGVAASVLLTRFLQAQLFGVAARDLLWVLPGVVLFLVGASVAAVVPPAVRAASIDPAIALKVE